MLDTPPPENFFYTHTLRKSTTQAFAYVTDKMAQNLQLTW